MRLTQLSTLLALPIAAHSIVILPESAAFAALGATGRRAPTSPEDPASKQAPEPATIDTGGPHRVKLFEKQVAEAIWNGDSLNLWPKQAIRPTSDADIDGGESALKITRLSPKFAAPPKVSGEDGDTPLPVIIWHGLGDSADAKGLKEVAGLIDEINPGTYTYLISLSGTMAGADRQASFFGNVNDQIDRVCHALAEDNILKTAPAVDAVGFSQGGQFLRGYIQRCGSWAPKVRSLITFGSQHNGIAEFQKCASPSDWVCQGANALLKSSTVWSNLVQTRLVPAQYYRDTTDYENYLEFSNYLADINNERKEKNATYVENLAALERFVMILFKDDTTVIPKESGWFAEVNATTSEVTQLRDRPIYTEDWIGLKKLDAKSGLVFEEVEGDHMQLTDSDLKRLFGKFFGPAGKDFDAATAAENDAAKYKLDL